MWLLGGYAAGFAAAAFVTWMVAGGAVSLTPGDVLLGGFLALLLHVPALSALQPANLELEVVVGRWVDRAGELVRSAKRGAGGPAHPFTLKHSKCKR
jgi:hypothetical protein